MKAILKKKDIVAKLTCYAEFEIQTERPDFSPGQYFFVTLKPEDKEHKDELTHHFTISNSPNQKGTLSFTTRLRLKESLFKRTLNDMQVGDEVEIGKIEGKFTMPDNPDKPIVFIALGIGITPAISMLHYIKEQNLDNQFTLIYSDNETQSMAFLDELKQLDNELDNFKLILSVTKQDDWQGEKRHVDGQFLKDYLKDIKNNLYYISGPPKVVVAVEDSLKEAGIPEENIKTDSFSGY